jgi:hypothetical protein
MIDKHWADKRCYYDLHIEPVADASARYTLLRHAMQQQVLPRVDHARWIKPLRALGERSYAKLLYAGYQYGYIIPDYDTIHELEDCEDKLFLFYAAATFGTGDPDMRPEERQEWELALDVESEVLSFLLLTRWHAGNDETYYTALQYSFLEFEPYHYNPFQFPNLVMHSYRLGSMPKDWHFEALGASDSKAWALVMAYLKGLTPVDRHFELFGEYAPRDEDECLHGRICDIDVHGSKSFTDELEIVDMSVSHYGLPFALIWAWELGLEPRWSHLQCLASDVIRLPVVTYAINEGILKLSREGINGSGRCLESDEYLRGRAVGVIEVVCERWMYRPGSARAAEGATRFAALASENQLEGFPTVPQ